MFQHHELNPHDPLDPLDPLLPRTSSQTEHEEQLRHYNERNERTLEIAREAGLHYVSLTWENGPIDISCHACGGVLLKGIGTMLHPFAEQVMRRLNNGYGGRHFVTRDSRCGHCGVDVPIVV